MFCNLAHRVCCHKASTNLFQWSLEPRDTKFLELTPCAEYNLLDAALVSPLTHSVAIPHKHTTAIISTAAKVRIFPFPPLSQRSRIVPTESVYSVQYCIPLDYYEWGGTLRRIRYQWWKCEYCESSGMSDGGSRPGMWNIDSVRFLFVFMGIL